ncbi:CoA transferase [Nocardioides sp. cx-169]|uniref:CaiB/BaiF CoA transferase family protein n=1 Tax=Nocardioides sp. cx-169 TaxID=2899080 RepID=UPI001E4D0EE8|nr:CoA transferase [Nocardioides sp. cx-169]MCD4534018.1 CoA transferase [Nocardioides sp. cx-169]
MTQPPLTGLKVLDVATLFAAPSAAAILSDFGAEVIKIEHPEKPDPARTHGASRNGTPLWWTSLSRNKRHMTLDLSRPEGREVFLDLVRDADVVIENFRPGTLERWGLGYDVLSAANPGIVLTRVTGFGQFGPRSHEPGFGSIGEAMSGFVFASGWPDRPPVLPPLALADHVSGMAAVIAIMMAVHERHSSGRGQVIDLAIIEPLLSMLAGQVTLYDQTGTISERLGNRNASNAPRGIYQTSDGDWIAMAASAHSTAERVMRLVGREDMVLEPWFRDGSERAKRGGEMDTAIAQWIGARTTDDVIALFQEAQAAIGVVNDMAKVMQDEQYAALGTITSVPDEALGEVRMPNVLFRLSRTPGAIRHTGRPHGADTEAILNEIGISAEQQRKLVEHGVIAPPTRTTTA